MTYEQRKNQLAEEFAREVLGIVKVSWDERPQSFKDKLINDYLPLAAIALKHMAEAYAEGHEQGTAYPHIDINLANIGLIQPQNNEA